MTDPSIRSTGIGGTDISAIMGLSPYKTAFDVWALKRGLISEPPPSKRMHFGKLLEQVIASEYCREMAQRTGQIWRDSSSHVEPWIADWVVSWDDNTRVNLCRPWQLYTPDAWAIPVGGPYTNRRGLDCKNVSLDQAHHWGEEGTDDIPVWILCQFHWYMSASGVGQWDAAMLLGGNNFRIYSVHRDEEIEAVLLETGERWWKRHIVDGIEPEIGASAGAKEYLRKRFPRSLGNIRAATATEENLLMEYAAVRTEFDYIEEQKLKLENEIKGAIGEADGITWPGGKVTWRKTKDRYETDWEAAAKWMLPALTDRPIAEYCAPYVSTVEGVKRFLYRGLVDGHGMPHKGAESFPESPVTERNREGKVRGKGSAPLGSAVPEQCSSGDERLDGTDTANQTLVHVPPPLAPVTRNQGPEDPAPDNIIRARDLL